MPRIITPVEVSLEDIPQYVGENLTDDEKLWCRDPFDILAEIEEEQGFPLNPH